LVEIGKKADSVLSAIEMFEKEMQMIIDSSRKRVTASQIRIEELDRLFESMKQRIERGERRWPRLWH